MTGLDIGYMNNGIAIFNELFKNSKKNIDKKRVFIILAI